MSSALVEICGLVFLAALGLQALTVFIEQLAAARSPEDEPPRSPWSPLLVLFTLLTPAILIVHSVIATRSADQLGQITAIGAPIAVTLLGALLGAITGAVASGAAAPARKIAPMLALITFAAAVFAAWPSVASLLP